MHQPSETALVPANAAEIVPASHLALDEHPVAVYLASLSLGSRRSMHGALDVAARLLTGGRQDAFTMTWGALRYQHTAAVRAALADRYAPATANKTLAAIRGTLKAAWRLGQISTDDYQRAVDLPAVRGETLLRGRALGDDELRLLFDACFNDRDANNQLRPAGARDAALLSILYGVGLRRSEAVALDGEDYEAETGTLTVRRGKGGKARLCYVGSSGREALHEWLAWRGDLPGALFLPVRKNSSIGTRRMTDQAVLNILTKRVQQAGIKHLSPHDLRRSFISDLLDAGADISTVQRMAGHANVTTTTRYDRRGEVAKQKAAELLNVPLKR